ncbi:type VII secretion-associated serine protease mycosin [Micromonospora globbae]|uniref:type VII secretion-associated serine protease mycosin n=1 Tax=Micromonospora globbae TaxID=1894969 RepID=UPI003B8A6AB8
MLSAAFAVVISLTAPTPLASASSNPSSESDLTDDAVRVRRDQWHLHYLRINEAHSISEGDGVIVAVPDTGVDLHPDLRNNVLPGADMVEGGSGDGRRDRDSHGTSMAGLIAAHGRTNGRGALGVAPRAKILPIFDSPHNGTGSPDALASSIDFAISHGADVISISAVAGASPRLQRALSHARDADVVVVAAAGNRPEDTSVRYPAAEEGVIAVGGIDRQGRRASVSVTGPLLDVAAPAVDIYSTSHDGKYSKGTGTSSATAIVAGAVALIRSKYPHLPAREVVHRLTATAVDKGPPGRDDEYGYGVIDIVAALTADVPPLGFESATASAPAGDGPSAPAAAPGDEAASDRAATVRGLVTLGVIVAAGVTWTIVVRRRRRDAPPPRISR